MTQDELAKRMGLGYALHTVSGVDSGAQGLSALMWVWGFKEIRCKNFIT